MSVLELFRYGDRDVRTLVIDEVPWFLASDVCAVLEFARTDRALAGFDDDEKGAQSMSTPCGDQHVSVTRWVTHEVLSQIRAPAPTPSTVLRRSWMFSRLRWPGCSVLSASLGRPSSSRPRRSAPLR